jgi:xylan 1,4-beta-xylosidase
MPSFTIIEQRYGQDEVAQRGSSKSGTSRICPDSGKERDQKAYFALYDLTSITIKAIDPNLRVGGPVNRRSCVGAGIP